MFAINFSMKYIAINTNVFNVSLVIAINSFTNINIHQVKEIIAEN